MTIKYENNTRSWTVFYGKWHPITKKYINSRRKGFKTENAAKKGERELIIEIESKMGMNRKPTWFNLVDSYLESCRKAGLAKKSVYNAEKCLQAATLPDWRNRFLDEISTEDIRNLICDKYASSSESHRKGILKFIRLAFAHAVELGWARHNPAPKIKFKIGKKLKSVLTYEQSKTLLLKAREMNWVWYPHVFIALYTGMRSGELFALAWNQINFEAGHLKVNRSWNNKDGFKSTKSGDDRIIDMAPELVSLLETLKLQTGNAEFVLPRIGRWHKGEQARELKLFLDAIGIPPVRFHDLRATWATLMLSRGVEPVKVMSMGGWRGMDTMMRYIREAGIDVKGISAVLKIHDPNV